MLFLPRAVVARATGPKPLKHSPKKIFPRRRRQKRGGGRFSRLRRPNLFCALFSPNSAARDVRGGDDGGEGDDEGDDDDDDDDGGEDGDRSSRACPKDAYEHKLGSKAQVTSTNNSSSFGASFGRARARHTHKRARAR